jgi:putative GTP pyrophosphokinase
MINQQEFLVKYRNKEKFETCGLEWGELEKIAADYDNCRHDLESTAKHIADCLSQVDTVHSLKIRTKDTEHLIEKIIRKKVSNPTFDINIGNYRTKITDLIGIRVLHLFKEDWIHIHDFITKEWKLVEKPTANIREGDSESFINEFKNKGCKIKKHDFGYRSVHYLVKSQATKETHIVEIQVRTIFEEGWSEIDHRIRYPYDIGNPTLNQYLSIFNRLAGSADEMGSFVRLLKSGLEEVSKKAQESLEEKDKAINELREQVKKLKIEKKEKDRLEAKIEELSKTSSITIRPDTFTSATILPSGMIGGSLLPTGYAGATVLPSGMIGSGLLSNESGISLAYAPKCSQCGKPISGSDSSLFTYPLLCSDCRMQGYTLRVK